MRFVANWHFAHDGRHYEPGDLVEVSADVAATAGAVLSPAEAASPAAPADGEAAGAEKSPRKGKGKGGA